MVDIIENNKVSLIENEAQLHRAIDVQNIQRAHEAKQTGELSFSSFEEFDNFIRDPNTTLVL